MDKIEKQKCIQEFKTKIADVVRPNHSDSDLAKWLKARNFNINEAEKMYRNSMVWRKKYNADTLFDTYVAPELLTKYYAGGICGQDKENRPIVIDPLGQTDLKGILLSCQQEDVIKFSVAKAERLQRIFDEKSKSCGRRIDQVIQILDLDGFGRKHLYKPGGELFVNMLSVIDHNYPEMLCKTFIINAPAIFQLGFSVIKPFLSEETKSKFVFLGSNWKTQLKDHIGTDEYPVHWGGKMTDEDGDPCCRSKICMGGMVPEEFYQTNLNKQDREGHEKVVVKHGLVHKVELKIDNIYDIINWHFYTEEKNIDFGLKFYKNKSSKGVVIEPNKTVNCHKIPERGNYICEETGTYELIFDNSKSWMTDKILRYKIEIEAKEKEIERLEHLNDDNTNL